MALSLPTTNLFVSFIALSWLCGISCASTNVPSTAYIGKEYFIFFFFYNINRSLYLNYRRGDSQLKIVRLGKLRSCLLFCESVALRTTMLIL